MKTRTKIPKLQMYHDKLYENVNENVQYFSEFLWWAIKATNMLQLYTAIFIYGFKSI